MINDYLPVIGMINSAKKAGQVPDMLAEQGKSDEDRMALIAHVLSKRNPKYSQVQAIYSNMAHDQMDTAKKMQDIQKSMGISSGLTALGLLTPSIWKYINRETLRKTAGPSLLGNMKSQTLLQNIIDKFK